MMWLIGDKPTTRSNTTTPNSGIKYWLKISRSVTTSCCFSIDARSLTKKGKLKDYSGINGEAHYF